MQWSIVPGRFQWVRFLAAGCCLCTALHSAFAAARITGEAGAEYVSFHYDEPGVMREDGPMFGVFGRARLEYRVATVRVEGSLDAGEIRYKGWLIDSETGDPIRPMELDTPNAVLNLRFLGGPVARCNPHLAIGPLVGMGFRSLYNDLPGVGGYTRLQNYLYLPVGFEISGVIAGGWEYVLTQEYDVFLYGENVSGGLSFTQDSGYGFHVSAGISGRLPGSRALGIRVEPFFRYWNIDTSSVSPDGWCEPANNCSEYGIRCSVLF
ncbi:MAG: hypothetical protein WCL44_05980 [bacterium]